MFWYGQSDNHNNQTILLRLQIVLEKSLIEFVLYLPSWVEI